MRTRGGVATGSEHSGGNRAMGTHRSFGELLRQYRAAAGLSQEELAERAGLSVRGIADLERGARVAPYPQTARKLADALNLADHERAELLAARTPRAITGGSAAAAPPEETTNRAIPLPLTSLIGRERECAEVLACLADHPVVTLVGVGGVGKTRLALAVASQISADEFPDGVYLVELAALLDGEQVPRAVASILGVPDQPGTGLIQVLVEVLRTRRLLLVLDNCEHLLDRCAELVELLLRSCVHLRVLATSREHLGIPGEFAFAVAPLAVADATPKASADTLVRVPAVRLFLERASISRPGFMLTDQNAATVADVCRELEGLPLAIELAAARLKLLSIDQLAARLVDRFRLLGGGSPTAPRRQQTLRAALDWSYDLLGEPEQVLLERLSVFVGGWTLEAAETVCAGGVVPADDVLMLLEHLFDHSLVLAEPGPDHRAMRYRVLETVRLYAEERLVARGADKVAHARRRHAHAFLALAERAEARLLGPAHAHWFARLEAEHANLRSALAWSVVYDTALAERLAAALTNFWGMGGYITEGRAWSERVIALGGPNVGSKARPRLLAGSCMFALAQGDLGAVDTRLAEIGQVEDQHAAAPHIRAGLLYIRGALAQRRGQWAPARAALEQAEALGRAAKFEGFAAMCLQQLAETSLGAGDSAGAYKYASRARALGDAVGYTRASGMALLTLGALAHEAGDLAAARGHFEASARLGQELGHGHGWWVTYALLNVSHVAVEQGQYSEARAALVESVGHWPELGNRATLARLLEACAHLAAATGGHVEALRLAGAAERLRRSAGRPASAAERVAMELWLRPAYAGLNDDAVRYALQDGEAVPPEQALSFVATSLAEARLPGDAARLRPRSASCS
jgi:predicted ATPase/transcriptional regulator with XRE-family HTH domain